jgi:hypothetical protein
MILFYIYFHGKYAINLVISNEAFVASYAQG